MGMFLLAGFFQHCNLKRHMISHNVDNGTEGFKCQHCQASFTTKSVLSVHMRDAHGDKLPTKKEQSRSTGTMVAAAAAAAAVAAASPPKTSPEKTSPPPAVAPSAEAAKLPSTSSSPVAAVGANWSQCRVCHKYFVTDANLKQHMLLHEGRKPFQCNFCGLRFSHKPNWKKHVMTHTPATEGYPCPTCSILFKTREDLAQHILKQHPLDSGGGRQINLTCFWLNLFQGLFCFAQQLELLRGQARIWMKKKRFLLRWTRMNQL